jgi:hypothetical protein
MSSLHAIESRIESLGRVLDGDRGGGRGESSTARRRRRDRLAVR